MSEGDGLGANRYPPETPRCTTCSHRRIYHTRLAYAQEKLTVGHRRPPRRGDVPLLPPYLRLHRISAVELK